MPCILQTFAAFALFTAGANAAAPAAAPPWQGEMLDTIRQCKVYGDAKKRGKAKKVKRKTMDMVQTFLVNNLKKYSNDAQLMPHFIAAAMPQRYMKDTSELNRVCNSPEHPELRAAWGHFMEAFAYLPGCLQHTSVVSEFEGKCFPNRVGDALQQFQWASDFANMERLWQDASSRSDDSGSALLRWPNPMMHPMITFSGIRNLPVWNPDSSSLVKEIMNVMQDNIAVFQQELQVLKKDNMFEPAYDSLVGTGSWAKASLFVGTWNEDLCKKAKKTCELFRGRMPGLNNGLPYLVPNNEEVAFFYSGPDSHVLPHNGMHNARVNIHLGLEGFEGSKLNVYTGVNQTEELHWSDKKAFAFNDGFQHEVINGPEHRYVLIVGIMHPDVDARTYARDFNGKTMMGDFGKEWQEKIRAAASKLDAESNASSASYSASEL